MGFCKARAANSSLWHSPHLGTEALQFSEALEFAKSRAVPDDLRKSVKL